MGHPEGEEEGCISLREKDKERGKINSLRNRESIPRFAPGERDSSGRLFPPAQNDL